MVEGYMALVEGAYSPELVGCNLAEVGEGCRREVDSWPVVEACSCSHIGEGEGAHKRGVVVEDHSLGEAGHSWFHIGAWGIP